MVGVSCNTSKVDNDRIAERIDSLLNSNYTDDAPGCAMAILKDDKVVYMGCRGIADVNTKEKINEHTVFNIASITKQFTALAILSLFEQGKLDINDSVAMYFPEFKSDIWKTVKLKHLMSHSSGVPDNRPRVDKDFMLHIVDKQCLEYMVDLDELKFEPGTKYDYKNPEDLIYLFFWLEEYIPNYRLDLSQIKNINDSKIKVLINSLLEWKKQKIKRDNHEIAYEEYLNWKLNYEIKGEMNNER